MIIIDTSHNNNSYLFNTFSTLAQAAGFKPTYKPWYEVDKHLLDTHQAIIIFFDEMFFPVVCQELNKEKTIKSPVLKKIFTLLDGVAGQRNKLIGFIMPSGCSAYANIGPLIVQFLRRFNMVSAAVSSDEVMSACLAHFLASDASKSYLYATTLLPQRIEGTCEAKILPLSPLFRPLPLYKEPLKEVAKPFAHMWPFGLIVNNPECGNSFFISNSTFLLSTEINEHFTFNPLNPLMWQELLGHILHVLDDVYACYHKTKPVYNQLPHSLTIAYVQEQKKNIRSHDNGIKKNDILAPFYKDTLKGAWMGIESYYEKDERAFENIIDAQLNILWFEFNPEWFLSPRGRFKDKRELFLKQISYFTAMLKKVAHKKGKPAPPIFMGTDITSNFAQIPVVNCAKDIYGKEYTKIPSPLDIEHFWQPELCQIITEFCQLWRNSIGNGLQLGGVFLDLEMYHAPTQIGQYTAIMDFSDMAWNYYANFVKNPSLKHIHEHNDRVTYLLQNKQLSHYYHALEKKSFEIGSMIRKCIERAVPEGIIGVYNIHLPYSWFYKGLCAGLSAQEKPIVFATFNANFFGHHAWLEKNNIHAFHMQVLLLSQLTDQNNFDSIKQSYAHHDGFWVNRFSRLEESRDKKDWGWDWGLETTPLSTSRVLELLNNISSK